MLRVASVPSSHVYVRHIGDPESGDAVVRLADPVPADGRKVPGGWWPPVMLEPGWVATHHDEFDVFHVHFGFDAVDADVLRQVAADLRRYHKPLVYTAHDLRNPHHGDPAAHMEQQNILMEAAAAVITLTPGAADTIAEHWGRRAHVLPHPHVLSPEFIERPRPHPDEFVIGVHVKSLRANMDPLPVIEALHASVSTLPDARMQIDVHDEVFDPASHWYAPEAAHAFLAYDHLDGVDVCVHPYFSDAKLWNYLSSLSVSVLPYRFGTHSGWLEACFDLGTWVVAPSCGFYSQQRSCGVFEFTETSFDADSLDHAVHDAYRVWKDGGSAPRATWVQRRAERAMIADAHHRLYRAVLA